jgi:hypothetical protein
VKRRKVTDGLKAILLQITMGGWIYFRRSRRFPWIKISHTYFGPALLVSHGDKSFWQTPVEPPDVEGKCDWVLLLFWSSVLLGEFAFAAWLIFFIRG